MTNSIAYESTVYTEESVTDYEHWIADNSKIYQTMALARRLVAGLFLAGPLESEHRHLFLNEDFRGRLEVAIGLVLLDWPEETAAWRSIINMGPACQEFYDESAA